MSAKSNRRKRGGRRAYDDELKGEAVQMLLDGHSAEAVAKNLGLNSVSVLYRWKAKLLRQDGAATAIRQLEESFPVSVLCKSLIVHSKRRRLAAVEPEDRQARIELAQEPDPAFTQFPVLVEPEEDGQPHGR
jgi:transposase-like protein